MQISFTTLLALLAASAQAQLPACADDCISGNNYGGCGQLNVQCICNNKSYIAGLACCVSQKCDAADQEATIQFADSICQGAGVTDLPTTATCASTASSTGSGSSSTSASGSSSTGSASSSMTTTSMKSSSSSSASASASSSASNTGAVNPTSANSVVSSNTASGSSATSSGAAATNKAEKVGLAMVIAGAIAAL